MKVIDFKGLVAKANGKVCEHSNISVAYNSRTGNCYSVTRHPETYEPHTPSQMQQQTIDTFKDRAIVTQMVLTKAKGDKAFKDKLIAIRDERGLASITSVALRAYDKSKKSIALFGYTFSVKDGTVESPDADNSGVDTPPIV